MGRRSDHTAQELRELLLSTGHALLADEGLARFSGRAAAKRANYSVGTIYNVFGSLGQFIAELNARTFTMWAEYLRDRLASGGPDRIRSLVEGYFDFAMLYPHLWRAIYEHRLAEGESFSADSERARKQLLAAVEQEVCAVLQLPPSPELLRYAQSLIATVHGHCTYVVSGTFARFDEPDPVGTALARVRESLAAQAPKPPG